MGRNPRHWARNPDEENAPLTDRGQAYPACGRGSSAVAVSSTPLHGDPDDDPTLRLLRQAFRKVPKARLDAGLEHLLAATPPKITVQWGERADGAPGAPLRVYRLATG